MIGSSFRDNTLIYCNNLYFVLGGGLLENGSLPKNVKKRCDYVISNSTCNDLALTSSSFSLNVPPKLDCEGYVISESSAMGNYLKKNESRAKVLTEQQSHDTFGAFFFLFSLYFQIINFKKLIIITSDFHIKRSKIIFEHLNYCWTADNRNFIDNYSFKSIKSVNDDEIKYRIKYEEKACKQMKERFKELSTREEISNYVLTVHTNYSLQYSGRRLIKSNKQGY